MKALFIMREEIFHETFHKKDIETISTMLEETPLFYSGKYVNDNPQVLKEIEIIFAGYGMCFLNENLLTIASNLKAVFFAGGSVKGIINEKYFNKERIISSAATANAIPVAEFTFAQIILALKNYFDHSHRYKHSKDYNRKNVFGCYKSSVGIISYGNIAKQLIQMINASLDLEINIYSPELNCESAKILGLNFCTLEELFEKSDVISLHAPNILETQKMIKGTHFEKMKANSYFINTARGQIVDEEEMIKVFKRRKDIFALLDVTTEMPMDNDSPLYSMDNIFMSPHIAGSMNTELQRLGNYAMQEFIRFMENKPLKYAVNEQDLKFKA